MPFLSAHVKTPLDLNEQFTGTFKMFEEMLDEKILKFRLQYYAYRRELDDYLTKRFSKKALERLRKTVFEVDSHGALKWTRNIALPTQGKDIHLRRPLILRYFGPNGSGKTFLAKQTAKILGKTGVISREQTAKSMDSNKQLKENEKTNRMNYLITYYVIRYYVGIGKNMIHVSDLHHHDDRSLLYAISQEDKNPVKRAVVLYVRVVCDYEVALSRIKSHETMKSEKLWRMEVARSKKRKKNHYFFDKRTGLWQPKPDEFVPIKIYHSIDTSNEEIEKMGLDGLVSKIVNDYGQHI